MTRDLFHQVTEWQKETFPHATSLSKIAHLKKELPELEEALKGEFDETVKFMEFADCFFLLFGAAAAHGMSYDDINKALEQKFSINKARKWGNPDKDGVVEHIRDGNQ